MISEGVIKEIAEIVGRENILQGKAALQKYFPRLGDRPQLVMVRPRDEYDMSEVAVIATDKKIPVYSVRREQMDPALAEKEGIIIDFSRMDSIKEIDRRNLMAHIYAGVTYEKLQEECLKQDCKLLLPVAATSRSVLRSYLDRDILMGSGGYRAPNLSIFHAVLSDGRIWVSGSQQMTMEGIADFREDQGPQFSLFFGASEDIFGIPFYGIVYTYPLRETRKVQLFAFDDLAPAKQLVYKASREEHCFEAFTANSRYLSVLCSNSRDGAEKLREKLPPWLAVITHEHHSELVEMWSDFVSRDAASLGGKPVEGELVDIIDRQLQKPWYLFDRDYYKGGLKHVFHYDFFARTPELFSDVNAAAEKNGYPASEVGQIIVPVYFGGAAYMESDLYYNPDDEAEAAKVEKVYEDAYRVLLDKKTFVDKPTGKLAEMVYERVDEGYISILKLFKKIVDPAGILNPEQLLQGV
jgi:FAD/FMN-containing dehydrogenase